MILYYAMGGGLGHLTRARAVLHTLGLEQDAVIITNSKYASDTRVMGPIKVLRAPAVGAGDTDCAIWIAEAIAKLKPDEMFLDAFPGGLYGEISEDTLFGDMPVTYVARMLRWERYKSRLPARPISLKTTLVVEQLSEPHQQHVDAFSANQKSIRLSDPAITLTVSEQRVLERLTRNSKPFWLIAHSGPAHEVAELLAYAADMRKLEGIDARLVVATTSGFAAQGTAVQAVSFYPIAPLANHASRIVTACGFNSMRQLEPFSFKHSFVPFERQFDDQFQRAIRYSRKASKARPTPATTRTLGNPKK